MTADPSTPQNPADKNQGLATSNDQATSAELLSARQELSHSVPPRASLLQKLVQNWQLIVAILLLAATLVPLVAISRYNHSYADDWHYGVWAHLALEHTHSVWAALSEALRQVGVAWFEWQGTYSAIFLMAIQPSVFGESAYSIAAPLVLALLVGSLLYMSHALLGRQLGLRANVWASLACLAASVMLLLQPSPVEGIFWYNSAMYYTGYNAFGFFLLGYVAKTLQRRAELSRRQLICRQILACALALWFAGGNFVSLLVGLELGLLLCMYLFATKRDELLLLLAPTVVSLLLGAIVSFVAPGNSVRQATQFANDKLGVGATLVQSTAAGFQYLSEWLSGLVILFVLFALPLFASALREELPKLKKRAPKLFAHPVPISACAVALFISSYTPTFYSMGTAGPGRVQNCRFELFVVLALVVALWWCGWVLMRLSCEHPTAGAAPEQQRAAQRSYRQVVQGACALVVAVALCVMWSASTNEEVREKYSSLSAAESLRSGQAAAYDAQVMQRLAFLENTSASKVTVPFYNDIPHVLLMGDIRDNMSNYINYRLAQWYELDSVIGVHASDANDGFSESNSLRILLLKNSKLVLWLWHEVQRIPLVGVKRL